MATKKKVVVTAEDVTAEATPEVEVEEIEEVDTLTPMIQQRDEYLTLLKRLQDEGIVNIGVLENKIARLNEAIAKV